MKNDMCNNLLDMFGWPEYTGSDIKFRKAAAMAQLGQKKEAAEFCKKWLQKEPENIIAACAGVYAFIEVKAFEDADKLVNQFISDKTQCSEVSETKDLILIDRMFVDEYTGSNYTNKLVRALPKVKANMSQGVPQMVESATEKRWKEDFDNKHKNRAGKGWFRYNTRFALPVTNDGGEIIEYKIYQAVLIVRYSADGKLYLYDIQNIKKKRDTHRGQIRQMVRTPLLLRMIVIHV